MKHTVRIFLLAAFGSIALGAIALLLTLKNGATSKNLPSAPDIRDGGFLSGEPCGPPCFLGIIPGVTREEQAARQLSQMGLYEKCYATNNESEGGLRGTLCYKAAITYFRGTDIVGAIGFRPPQHLTVEMTITEYGEPDAVSVASNWFSWEKQPTTSMALIYQDAGTSVIVDLGQQEGATFEIAPPTLIDWIDYSDNTFPSSSEYESSAKYLSPWHGYGTYRDVSTP
jgi:hypothetical protein